jgi:hypothetical protein
MTKSALTPPSRRRKISPSCEIGAERIFFGTDRYALDTPETREVSQHRNQLAIVANAQMSDRERDLVLGESIAAFLTL